MGTARDPHARLRAARLYLILECEVRGAPAAEHVAAADASGADYLGVGPVFETPTKPGRRSVGLALVEHAASNASKPWFAIGGIDAGNAPDVIAAGASRIAVVRAIRDADDPGA